MKVLEWRWTRLHKGTKAVRPARLRNILAWRTDRGAGLAALARVVRQGLAACSSFSPPLDSLTCKQLALDRPAVCDEEPGTAPTETKGE